METPRFRNAVRGGDVPAWWILAFLLVQRAGELLLCRRNRRALLLRGGREFFPESYPVMVALHVLFLLSLALESLPREVPLDPRTWACLAALVPVTFLRYWSIATLGTQWSTRIVAVPGTRVIRSGPYRVLRHPNYVVLVLEFLLFPLLLRAPFTLVAFSLANLAVLRQRIHLEEAVLLAHTDYGERFSFGKRNAADGSESVGKKKSSL